jgi:hypothetical protein
MSFLCALDVPTLHNQRLKLGVWWGGLGVEAGRGGGWERGRYYLINSLWILGFFIVVMNFSNPI